VLRQLDGLGRAVGAGPGDDGDSPGGPGNGDFDHAPVFIMAESRRLARRAGRHQAVRALSDLEIHQPAQCVFVKLAVLEGRYECGNRSFEHFSRPSQALSAA
jgi:hypothetical protein